MEPRVQIGHGAGQAAVLKEIDRALTAHELIKVRILDGDRDAREAIGDQICAQTEAARVQSVGKVLVLWRPKPQKEE